MSERVTKLDWKVAKIMRARAEHMEMFCAAFIRETGSASVRDWELVEQIECNPEEGILQRVIWKFRKSAPETATVLPVGDAFEDWCEDHFGMSPAQTRMSDKNKPFIMADIVAAFHAGRKSGLPNG